MPLALALPPRISQASSDNVLIFSKIRYLNTGIVLEKQKQLSRLEKQATAREREFRVSGRSRVCTRMLSV